MTLLTFRFVNYYIFPMKWTLSMLKQIERLFLFHVYSQHREPWQENLLPNFNQTTHCGWTLVSSIYSVVPLLFFFKVVEKILPNWFPWLCQYNSASASWNVCTTLTRESIDIEISVGIPDFLLLSRPIQNRIKPIHKAWLIQKKKSLKAW